MKGMVFLTAVAGSMVLLACADHGTGPVADPRGIGTATASDDSTGTTTARDDSTGTTTANDGRIAFASSRGGRWRWPDIYVANDDGTDVSRLTVGTAPAWSPDGRRIAFRRDDNPYDRSGIYIINADGSGERFLSVGWSPAWASDGRLAFSLGKSAPNSSIAMMNPDGTGFRHLLRGPSLVTAGESCDDGWLAPHVDRPAWSPDGRQIAFVLTCSGEWSRLFAMNADGSEPRRLVDSWQAYSPAWSPDGSRIAANVDGSITVMDVLSGTWQNSGVDARHDGKLDWSPDGRQLVFAAGDPGEERIFVLALETGDVRQLVAGTIPDYYADFDVAWSR